MHDDDDQGMNYSDNEQQDWYDANEDGNESNINNNINNMKVDNDKNESDKNKDIYSSSLLKKQSGKDDMNVETTTEESQKEEYYDLYNKDGEVEDLFKDYDFSSVEVNSSVRSYQQENEIEEENFGNVEQHRIISITEVTKATRK